MRNKMTYFMSLEEAIARYSTDIFRMAYARTNNMSDAEDITQDVYVKYMLSGRKFQNEEHVKAWLLRVAINSSKNLLKSAWHRKKTPLEEADAIYTELQNESEVYYAVMQLPQKYRTVIHLYYYEGYSVREIGKIMSAKESTVKSWLHRARSRLEEVLKEEIDV